MLKIKKISAPSRFLSLNRIRHIVGIDRAIGFTIFARGWNILAGVVTVTLIARLLTPSEQGYYFTFSSLVALQIVFELGFSFVILQLAAHECAHLTIEADGSIIGDSVIHSRLASILIKSIRWYSVGAVLLLAILLPVGLHFFLAHQQAGGPVAWKMPWVAVVLATTVTFQMDPIFAFLEGCGRIHQVARLRFTQACLGSLMAWIALGLHHGLFAPAMTIGGQVIAGAFFLYTQRHLLLPLMRFKPLLHLVEWRTEIWPFQWRIAISWLCGYFIFQLFNPVLFAYRGAAEAGRMGMTLSITTALSSVAVSWMSTKAPSFGSMVAKKDYSAMDKLFFRTLVQSTALLAAGSVTLLFGLKIATVVLPRFTNRVLPLPSFALLLLTTLLNHIVFCQAIYLRAHKKEPFLIVSVVVGVLTGISTLITGHMWGASGITAGYLVTSGIIGLIIATRIFLAKRREWHACDMVTKFSGKA